MSFAIDQGGRGQILAKLNDIERPLEVLDHLLNVRVSGIILLSD
jgi:hypothetical protein